MLDILLQTASEEQKRYYFDKVLGDLPFRQCLLESKSKNASAFETRIRFNDDSVM